MNGWWDDPAEVERIADLEWRILRGEGAPDDVTEYHAMIAVHESWIRAQPWFQQWQAECDEWMEHPEGPYPSVFDAIRREED